MTLFNLKSCEHYTIREEGGVTIMRISFNNKRLGNGSYGDYYSLHDGRGIKVLRNYPVSAPTHIETRSDTVKEIRNLQKAKEQVPELAPEFYGMIFVETRYDLHRQCTEFCPGLIVDHIDGDHFSHGEFSRLLRLELEYKLASKGIYHGDIHDKNFIVTDLGRPIIVDWGICDFNYGVSEHNVKKHRENYEKQLEEVKKISKYLHSYVPFEEKKIG